MKKIIKKELLEHIPFTFGATLFAILLIYFFYESQIIPSEALFEVLHPLHVLASAITTAAIYSQYKKSLPNAILIGVTGSIIIGTISDILLPFLGGNLFQLQTHLHLPIIEEPILIIGTALLGSAIGIKTKISEFPHLMHVLISVFASLFYLTSFSEAITLTKIALSTITIFIAVILPCCLSDIVYPLLFVKKKSKTLKT